MRRREKSNMIIDNPLYIRISDMKGEQFFFQPSTLELYVSCPRLSQSQGGFLCEELGLSLFDAINPIFLIHFVGTGKTVMILALILSSLDDLPHPPEDASDTILTPLSLNLFPYHQPDLNTEYSDISLRKDKPRFPSLTEILCDYIRRCPERLDLRSYEDTLDDRQLWQPIMNNVPFYLHDNTVFKEVSSRRQRNERLAVKYLSAATLIVVPKALQAQWTSEIMKHCSNSVRTLIIGQKSVIPPAQKLASDFDVSEMSRLPLGVSNYLCTMP